MTGIAATSRWTAAVRALESARPDALFRDPWASLLAGEEGLQWAEARPAWGLATMAVRTRFFDDFLEEASRGGVAQVVLLGAGLDTRALRLAWPSGVTVFEVDQPDVVRTKREILEGAGASPRCARWVCLPADLAGPDWPARLEEAGLDVHAPSAWLAEGLLFYLALTSVMALLERVSGLAAEGSRLGFDIPNRAMLTHPAARSWVEMQAAMGAPWIGALDDPAEPLTALGWTVAVTQFGEPDADYGRWALPVPPREARDLPHHWLVTARRGGGLSG